MDHIDARNRSYAVRDACTEGDRLIALEEIKRNVPLSVAGPDAWKEWRPVVIAKGEEVLLLSESNAGFRGIEFSVLTADGERVHGISAGLFQVIAD